MLCFSLRVVCGFVVLSIKDIGSLSLFVNSLICVLSGIGGDQSDFMW